MERGWSLGHYDSTILGDSHNISILENGASFSYLDYILKKKSLFESTNEYEYVVQTRITYLKMIDLKSFMLIYYQVLTSF